MPVLLLRAHVPHMIPSRTKAFYYPVINIFHEKRFSRVVCWGCNTVYDRSKELKTRTGYRFLVNCDVGNYIPEQPELSLLSPDPTYWPYQICALANPSN